MYSLPPEERIRRVQTVWLVPISVVAAVNLRLIVPGVLARLGLWKPPARI
jgi:hypothetical protein